MHSCHSCHSDSQILESDSIEAISRPSDNRCRADAHDCFPTAGTSKTRTPTNTNNQMATEAQWSNCLRPSLPPPAELSLERKNFKITFAINFAFWYFSATSPRRVPTETRQSFHARFTYASFANARAQVTVGQSVQFNVLLTGFWSEEGRFSHPSLGIRSVCSHN